MERFIRTLGILIIMLFLLASGLDATMNRLISRPRQSQFVACGPRGERAISTGDVNRLAQAATIDPSLLPRFLRRAKAPIPASADVASRLL